MGPLTAIVLLVALAAAVIAVRSVIERVIVYQYQAGLKFKKGKLAQTLDAGKYWYLGTSSRVQIIDLRPRFVTVPGQEVLTSDHIPLKISLAAQYRVSEPRTAYIEVENYVGALYLQLQLALREIVGGHPVDEVLALRDEWGSRLKERCAESAAAIGLELISAEVKDIMFPGAIKQVFTQVVRAREEGIAALEKARGETAALRKLANAARMIEKNPALMQLRLLHSLGEAKGSTLVVNLGSDKVFPGGAVPPAGEDSKSD